MATLAETPVKNALTGATVFLSADEAALYQEHLTATFNAFAPADHREKLLVQTIADLEWRLQKIPVLIESIFALGRSKDADKFEGNPMLLEAHVQVTYTREIRQLYTQENRMHRQREKYFAELKELQRARHLQREGQLEAAAKMHQRFEEEHMPFDPFAFGFEFSIDEIEERVGLHEAKRIGCEYPQQFAKHIHAKLLRDERLGLLPAEEDPQAA